MRTVISRRNKKEVYYVLSPESGRYDTDGAYELVLLYLKPGQWFYLLVVSVRRKGPFRRKKLKLFSFRPALSFATILLPVYTWKTITIRSTGNEMQ